jgi:mono/diheme cytochrome c family protein
MHSTITLVALSAAALLALAGCGKSHSGSTETSGATPAATAAGTGGATAANGVFKSRCAACHGNEGRGDGPGAAALNPKPRNYHDTAWQTQVSDDQIKKTIVYGGAAVGKSPMMPANPDLDAKPEVVDNLVRIVRGFGKS